MNRKVFRILVVFPVLLGLVLFTGLASASHAASEIGVCCAWNGALNDSDSDGVPDLTYSVSGGASVDRATVTAAVEEWETALAGAGYLFELNPVPARTGENIKITLKKGGGVVAGMAKRSFDKAWFVKAVTISISLKAFGAVNDQATLSEVTRHEMGHAAGLGHANFDDLMDETVGGVNTIRGCDVMGVAEANRWRLIDGLSTPSYPGVNHVGCNADGSFNSLP